MTTNKGLQVWLPLNGTLENKGLVKSTITSNGVSWSNSGKIGKCFDNSDRGTRWILLQNAFPAHDTDHTVCFWVKSLPNIAVSNDWGYIYTTSNVNATDAAKCCIATSITNGFSITDSCPVFIVTVNDRTQWNHITIVTTKTKVVVYVNGQYSNEQTRNTEIESSATRHIAISRNSTGLGTTWNMRGSINDFRVYSYALSPQEIKELSRCKVGHWLGDGNGMFPKNLLTGNTDGADIPANYQLIYCNSVISYKLSASGTHLVTPNSDNANNGFRYFVDAFSKAQISLGKTYTISCSVKGTSDTNKPFLCIGYNIKQTSAFWYQNCVQNVKEFTPTDIYQRISCTITLPATEGSVEIFYFGVSGNKQSDLWIKDWKLEQGTMPSLYSASNQAFLSDISGFGRHGQVVGDVTLAEDTPRYDKSLKYNGGNVVVTGLPTMSTYTISWWDKFPAGTGQLFDWRLGPVNTSMDSSSAGVIINNNTCQFKIGGVATDPQNYSNYGITANTWYHCCLVCDDSKSRLYINGIQKWEASKGSIADFSQLILGGKDTAANDGYQYTGQHSDFRIYATALSADDVKELYSLGH